jgi:hypothetical protein
LLPVSHKILKEHLSSAGFPIKGAGDRGFFPRQKLKKCPTFCQNFKYFLRNFLQPRGKFWQKPGFLTLFALFLAESQIKTLSANKISQKVDNFSILCSVSARKSYEGTFCQNF